MEPTTGAQSKSFLIIIVVGLLIIVGGADFLFSGNSKETREKMMKDGESMIEDGTMMSDEEKMKMMEEGKVVDEKMMEKMDEAMMMKKGEETMKEDGAMKKGTFESYSAEKLSLASSGKVALFFHATWCPICRAIEKEILADPSKISDGVHILKVDYDNNVSLRQKYGVTTQHTFVQVDDKGNSLQKWSDSSTLSSVLSRIK